MSQHETRFYTAVNKKLPKGLHYEKMHNPFTTGCPDIWYSGPTGDLWVEYKYLPALPMRAGINVSKMLSARQRQWLDRRYKEGRNVAVILGTPEGHWVFWQGAWNEMLPAVSVREGGYTIKELVDFICSIINRGAAK